MRRTKLGIARFSACFMVMMALFPGVALLITMCTTAPPPAPVITGVEDGETYVNCTLSFAAPAGETFTATLSRNGGTAENFTSGTKILMRGSYELVVTATRISDGLTSQTAINFYIDRNLDIDGDGYEDMVLGANGSDSWWGSAFVYFGDGSSFTPGSPLTLDDPDSATNAYFGWCVASAGDVNGDGYDEIVIGAPGTDTFGSAFVYYGSASGLVTASFVDIDSPVSEAWAGFGESVAGAGDVNGDGYDDIVIGAHNMANGGANRGSVFVYYGSASGPVTANPLELENPDNEDGAAFGESVAGSGDLNRDGYDDIVIGAPGTDNGGSNRGSSFVYYGSASGLVAGSPLELDEPDDEDGAEFGLRVAGAGDVNGDGYDDIVIGAHNTNNGGSGRGSAFLYYGSASGLVAASPLELDDPDNQDSAFFGSSVAGAGDVNGDGYDDIVIGAPGTNNNGSSRGSAFVYNGSASGLSTASPLELEDPDDEDDSEFGFATASAGDVNGDGYGEVVVGAPHTSNGGTWRGSAFVYNGSASGLITASPMELDDPDNQDYAMFGCIQEGDD
jgi:hypothetical protein